jgi:hypothetical protein
MPIKKVQQLTPASRGRWLVTTSSGRKHVIDLDTFTYRRRPARDAAVLNDDRLTQRILDIQTWPQVGKIFRMVLEDSELPDKLQRDMVSTPVTAIEAAK